VRRTSRIQAKQHILNLYVVCSSTRILWGRSRLSNTMIEEKQIETEIEETSADDDSPKFGRLLIVLLLAVALIVVITFATEAYHGL
jgi:hypothetical protein